MTSFGLAAFQPGYLDEIEASLSSLEPLLAEPLPKQYLSRRLAETVRRLFEVAGQNRLGGRLEQIVLLDVDLDLAKISATLEDLANEVAQAGKQDLLAQNFQDARELLAATSAIKTTIGRLELGARLEMVVNRVFGFALRVLPRPNSLVDRLVAEVAAKVGLLSEREVAEVWAKITNEIEVGPGSPVSNGIPLDASIATREFFDARNASELPLKIATYLVDIRHRLVEVAINKGVKMFPFPPLAVAEIVGWKHQASTPSQLERNVARHVRLLAQIAIKHLDSNSRELADALNIPEPARILAPEDNARDEIPAPGVGLFRVAIAECRAVLTLLSQLNQPSLGYEFDLLRRYKLSLEFAPRENRELFTGKNEEFCQRNLASFLIGHGAFAVGTRFGPQETDLVTGSTLDPLIIEAKLFRSGSPPATGIQKATVQLREYMDKAPFKSRGALVLFNLTEVPIIAPRELLLGRIAIVAVNLPQTTASKHDRLCVISPATDGRLVDVGTAPVEGKRSRKGTKRNLTSSRKK